MKRRNYSKSVRGNYVSRNKKSRKRLIPIARGDPRKRRNFRILFRSEDAITAIGQQNPILLFLATHRVIVASSAAGITRGSCRCRVVAAMFVVGVSEMKRKASNSGVRKIANIKI